MGFVIWFWFVFNCCAVMVTFAGMPAVVFVFVLCYLFWFTLGTCLDCLYLGLLVGLDLLVWLLGLALGLLL